MYFEDVAQIQKIGLRCNAAVFVLPDDIPVNITNALFLQPEDKSVITIEQVRQMIGRLDLKLSQDLFVVIRPADKMQPEAANAFLKSLEEPGEYVHYLLITNRPSMLLPTIMSRSALYCLRIHNNDSIDADAKIKDMAKHLMVARPLELVELAEQIVQKKDNPRRYALEVVSTAIEMLYKTYYVTRKDVFIKKLPKFLTAYEHLQQNGHIKLQIVASLI